MIIATYCIPSSIMLLQRCIAFLMPLLNGDRRDNIVNALVWQTNTHTPARDILTDALGHLASIYPPGDVQDSIIDELVAQADFLQLNKDAVTRPQHTAILRVLDSIVVGPPARNLVVDMHIQDLNRTQEHLLETYLKTRGIHGAVIPVPAVAGSWRYVRCLGTGGESTAHLYLHLDNSSRVTDRVVQRNVVTEQGQWDLPANWAPNTAIGTYPKESWIMDMLPQDPNIIHLRNTVLDPANFMFIHYVDFVEHGNLWDLIEMHARESYVIAKNVQDTNDANFSSRRNTYTPASGRTRYKREDPRPFDESFLWHLFRSLVSGLDVMDNAVAQQAHAPLSRPEIVHGDLHPGNVFLGAENPASFRLYPTPKVR
ncbi:hypothetical protein BDV97DRAFT_124739 [Delphinella strobiligena]|nr:hypothetical protein BDV97DRAFT_124739 [Delphinella strobiligena]